MKHIYFVRHGLSVMNKLGKFSGRTNTPLAPEGEEEAILAGQEARDLNIDLIISSPMERTIETAQIIAKEMGYDLSKILISDFFMERAFGILEGTEYSKTKEVEGIEGVESTEELLIRAQKGLDFINQQPGNTVLIVSHGAIGRALRHILTPNIPFKGEGAHGFTNGKIYKLI